MERSEPARKPVVTLRQRKLAETLETSKTYTEALVKAGYAPASARSSALDLRERSGTKAAQYEQVRTRLDKAKGILGLAEKLASVTAEDIADLDPDRRLLLASQFLKVAHDLGVQPEVETAHNPPLWLRAWLRRGLMRAYKLGRESVKPL